MEYPVTDGRKALMLPRYRAVFAGLLLVLSLPVSAFSQLAEPEIPAEPSPPADPAAIETAGDAAAAGQEETAVSGSGTTGDTAVDSRAGDAAKETAAEKKSSGHLPDRRWILKFRKNWEDDI